MNSLNRAQWRRYEPGEWLPKDPNEAHDMPLYILDWNGVRVACHKTKDGKRWVARASTKQSSVPHGRLFYSRREAWHDAMIRIGVKSW